VPSPILSPLYHSGLYMAIYRTSCHYFPELCH